MLFPSSLKSLPPGKNAVATGVAGQRVANNGITVMRSGLSVNVTCGCDSARIGVTSARPHRVTAVPLRPAQADIPSNQYNIGTRPADGTFGNVGRNTLKGPAAYNWDFSLFKNFKVREAKSVQFRGEMFNIFNTPQFSNPGHH